MTDPQDKPPIAAPAQEPGPGPAPTLGARIRALFTEFYPADHPDAGPKTSNELARIRTDLAVSRTLMGADRTLMAWVRTSLSMDSFGFTIYKLLQSFAEGGADLPGEGTPREIGLFLTGLGTVAMVMGTIEYWGVLKELRELDDFRLARPSLIMAVLMSVLSVFLFFSIITKLF